MAWSLKFGILGRGAKLVTGLVKAKLTGRGRDKTEPRARLLRVDDFGDNPARLRMLTYAAPASVGRPMVVLLHGCGQDAAAFAAGSGWEEIADRLRFPLILPEQMKANNAARCFQ